MSETLAPREGGCRCGRMRFRIDAPPILTMACHCRGCQRMTAGAFSLGAAIPTPAFAVLKGEAVPGGLHGAAQHLHCPYCMSWIFTRPQGLDAFVTIRSSLLDDPAGFAPFIETQTAEKLPWASTSAAHSFAGFPAPEDYEGLMKSYAARPAEV